VGQVALQHVLTIAAGQASDAALQLPEPVLKMLKAELPPSAQLAKVQAVGAAAT
jgi:hypothetical protein